MEKVKARILVVEDEQSVGDAIAKILLNYGYGVVTAADVAEGLKCFEEQGGFDMVLTDLSLPGLSGLDLAAAVRKKSPGTPVVLLSGWDVSGDDAAVRHSGVSVVLQKPVRVKEMLKVVEEMVSSREQE